MSPELDSDERLGAFQSQARACSERSIHADRQLAGRSSSQRRSQ